MNKHVGTKYISGYLVFLTYLNTENSLDKVYKEI